MDRGQFELLGLHVDEAVEVRTHSGDSFTGFVKSIFGHILELTDDNMRLRSTRFSVEIQSIESVRKKRSY